MFVELSKSDIWTPVLTTHDEIVLHGDEKYRDEMANALQRISTLNNDLVAKELAKLPYADRWQLQPRNPSWIDKLFDTHPPMEKRQ